MTVSASAMTYGDAKREALFLSDKMAYELALNEAQYAAVYNINLDYLMALDRHDIFGYGWSHRNTSLRRVLSAWQYEKYLNTVHFYRPASWRKGAWVFGVYDRYGRNTFHMAFNVNRHFDKAYKHNKRAYKHNHKTYKHGKKQYARY